MKLLYLLVALFLSIGAGAQQHTPLPHGTVYGKKPSITSMMPATKLEAYMGNRTRISTTIEGKVIKVTKTKGGWFELDAGNGKIINAHFKDYAVTIPTDLKGRTVIIEGVAQKQFIADDGQHFAGDTVAGKKQHNVNANPKQSLTFEVSGLMVDK
ncbi:protein of unknown function [Mucilaginibacter mallensis]|uniref:DUF4920 domain-containing protein n=1 Tax=Mucilaginibacter mallensis TaxID=652787 RepID=A0A1H1N2N7_MUCMA|nr:DUF4920 domain-containing protein [Mucilaginibacter mallensis]SDR93244.1 protein of unknown function [Mucilaginibacter mallensis]